MQGYWCVISSTMSVEEFGQPLGQSCSETGFLLDVCRTFLLRHPISTLTRFHQGTDQKCLCWYVIMIGYNKSLWANRLI